LGPAAQPLATTGNHWSFRTTEEVTGSLSPSAAHRSTRQNAGRPDSGSWAGDYRPSLRRDRRAARRPHLAATAALSAVSIPLGGWPVSPTARSSTRATSAAGMWCPLRGLAPHCSISWSLTLVSGLTASCGWRAVAPGDGGRRLAQQPTHATTTGSPD